MAHLPACKSSSTFLYFTSFITFPSEYRTVILSFLFAVFFDFACAGFFCGGFFRIWRALFFGAAADLAAHCPPATTNATRLFVRANVAVFERAPLARRRLRATAHRTSSRKKPFLRLPAQ